MKINPKTQRPYGKPAPVVSATRNAIKACLHDAKNLPPRALVACSGGPDSMALAVSALFVAQRSQWNLGAVIVDHQLQAGSDEVAMLTRQRLEDIGYKDVFVVQAPQEKGGLETAARHARYKVFDQVKNHFNASIVMTAHHQNDQAETVLMSLLRGSGPKSLAGIPPRRGAFRRPLLALRREELRQVCIEEKITFWDDPTNKEFSTPRNIIRHRIIPQLEKDLSYCVIKSLATSAKLCREDVEALEHMAYQAFIPLWDEEKSALTVAPLKEFFPAVRKRILKIAAEKKSSFQLSTSHIDALDTLITQWHGQQAISLPGGISAYRARGAIFFEVRMRS